MPSLKAIRKRIVSVKNTKKITSAMKLVAAARLKRAQDAMFALRPYANRFVDVIADLAARAGSEAHPFFKPREERRVQLLIISSDRGLCGGFNSNLNRRTERYLIDNQPRISDVRFLIVGRKGRDYFRRKKVNIVRELPAPVSGPPALELARTLAQQVTADFLDERNGVDAVYLVYNEFKSAITQRVTVEPLLPVRPAKLDDTYGRNDFRYEPAKDELISHLVPLHIETQIYRALLESIASEFGARMSAMESASKNAIDMIGRLTLEFNRARQAAITKELMEIVGGAEALKG